MGLCARLVTGPELLSPEGIRSENERFEFQASFCDEEQFRRLHLNQSMNRLRRRFAVGASEEACEFAAESRRALLADDSAPGAPLTLKAALYAGEIA